MVTTQEPQENDQTVTLVEPEAPQEQPETPPVEQSEQPTEEATQAPSSGEAGPTVPAPIPQQDQPPGTPAAPQQPQMTNQEINELYRRRTEEQDRMDKDKIGRTAQRYKQQLESSGYLPDQASEQMQQYMRNEMQKLKQRQESSEALANQQAKTQVTIELMKKHGLADKQALSDFELLQAYNSPDEMEREVQRMKRERDLIKENTLLKQGRVSPQTFDNTQGAAEVTSNRENMLIRYNQGDRSEAVRKVVEGLF